MPLSNPWTPWERGKPPEVVGVYELGHMTFGEVRLVYIGSGSIARRVRCHARDEQKTFEFYRCLRTCDRRRARQRERSEQRQWLDNHGHLPTYNSRVG